MTKVLLFVLFLCAVAFSHDVVPNQTVESFEAEQVALVKSIDSSFIQAAQEQFVDIFPVRKLTHAKKPARGMPNVPRSAESGNQDGGNEDAPNNGREEQSGANEKSPDNSGPEEQSNESGANNYKSDAQNGGQSNEQQSAEQESNEQPAKRNRAAKSNNAKGTTPSVVSKFAQAVKNIRVKKNFKGGKKLITVSFTVFRNNGGKPINLSLRLLRKARNQRNRGGRSQRRQNRSRRGGSRHQRRNRGGRPQRKQNQSYRCGNRRQRRNRCQNNHRRFHRRLRSRNCGKPARPIRPTPNRPRWNSGTKIDRSVRSFVPSKLNSTN